MERAAMIKKNHLQKPCNMALRAKDASFSSCLIPEEAIGGRQHHEHLTAIGDDSTAEISIFDAHKYFNESTNMDAQKVMIGINGDSKVSPVVNVNGEHNIERSCDNISSVPSRYSSASSSVDGYGIIRNYRARSFRAATPTASSEASWNSQTGLLSHPQGEIAVSIRKPENSTDQNTKVTSSLSTTKWLFGRCPCAGKKSVQVEKKTLSELKEAFPQIPTRHLSQNQNSRSSLNQKQQDNAPVEKFILNMETVARNNKWVDHSNHKFSPPENHFPPALKSQRVVASVRPFIDHASGFTFPVLDTPSKITYPPVKSQALNGVDDNPHRDSLEVFRPLDFERKPNEGHRQNFTFIASPKARIPDDDVASDASSDLFEIESFSTTQTTSTNPILYRRRDSLDEVQNLDSRRFGGINGGFLCGRRSVEESMTPTITECYEPSEASVDWSVTTAEGFDRASVTNYSVTASDITEEVREQPERSNRKGKGKGGGSGSGNGNGGLLSCRWEKAVSVGPQPVKCVPAAEEHRGATPLALRHVVGSSIGNSRPAIAIGSKPPLARSHSARLARPVL